MGKKCLSQTIRENFHKKQEGTSDESRGINGSPKSTEMTDLTPASKWCYKLTKGRLWEKKITLRRKQTNILLANDSEIKKSTKK